MKRDDILCYTGTPAYGPSCANLTSSIKPKYITYRHAAREGSSQLHR